MSKIIEIIALSVSSIFYNLIGLFGRTFSLGLLSFGVFFAAPHSALDTLFKVPPSARYQLDERKNTSCKNNLSLVFQDA